MRVSLGYGSSLVLEFTEVSRECCRQVAGECRGAAPNELQHCQTGATSEGAALACANGIDGWLCLRWVD